jgi:Cys-tRNA(Pro)/Cys-tRNA(Cys) deacylase
MKKTNAIRLLEAAGIEFIIKEYNVDENDLSGETVAKKIGAEPEQVFKTLVTRNEQMQIKVFCIPVSSELDLKKAALASNSKRIEMVKPAELFDLTGYVRGGCSPVGMKRPYPVYFDETIILFDMIFISAGTRGMQLGIKADDLMHFISAVNANLQVS